MAARYKSNPYIKVRPESSYIGLNRNYGAASTISPVGIALERPSSLYAIQSAAPLDVAGVCRDDSVGHTQKSLNDDSSDLEIFVAPRAPKNVALTSAAMKKKFHPAAWILRSSANPSNRLTTLQFPEQASLCRPKICAIAGESSIKTVPT
jgi:hypothetical protein